MQDYLAELSRYGEVNAAYPHFDAYWSEDDRWPYLIEVDDQLAGFALVNKWSPSHQGTDFAVAEFYILPDFRNAGIGGRACDGMTPARHPTVAYRRSLSAS
jgi:predicted acetyltransferase